jgi:ABC-type branched-subunit amino acid transport system ATPase component/branched-subunit amino acid ABC-type transport system permease component
VAFLAAPVLAAAAALIFGLLCIRLTRIYFSMLTLAFSQIVWAVAHKWYSLTGGDNGLVPIPVPEALAGPRAFYLFTLACSGLAAGALWRLVNAPFGRTLLAIRENAERAEFVGVHVKRVQLVAFVISGGVSGLAGALFALFSRGAFPDYAFWTKSAEVLLMTLLGGPYVFLGPALGAGILIVLNSVVTSFTEYWPVVLGAILLLLIYVFPGGVTRLFRSRKPAGGRRRRWPRRSRRGDDGARCSGGGRLAVLRRLPGLGGVTLRVEPGEISAVIGPNGAGKTTLFNVITGHLVPDSGRVGFGGRDITGQPPHAICRLGLARSFQRTNIFPRLTVFENVQIAILSHEGRAYGIWSPARSLARERTMAILEDVGLAHRAADASGASRTRTRSSSSWASRSLEPTLLLLDEPTGGMSQETRASIALVRAHRSAAQAHRAVHRARHGRGLLGAQSILRVLHQGRIIAEGRPEEIRGHAESSGVPRGGRAGPAPAAAMTLGSATSTRATAQPDPLRRQPRGRRGEGVCLLVQWRGKRRPRCAALVGLTPPHRGRVVFDGTDITGWPPFRIARRGSASCRRSGASSADLSVRENLEVARRAAVGPG